jgi:hypothetical protein
MQLQQLRDVRVILDNKNLLARGGITHAFFPENPCSPSYCD